MKSPAILPPAARRLAFFASTALVSLGCVAKVRAAEAAPAFHSIFNGKDLAGWAPPTPNPFWRVEDGALVGQNDEKLTGSILWTQASHKDFIFEADMRWEGPIDSGVFVRKPALQMQIGTSVSQKRDLTGSFYISKVGYVAAGAATDAPKYLKLGDWNALRLEARGDTFTVWINGYQVAHYVNAAYAESGPIGVQVHPKVGGKIEFKNVRLADLP
jgi:hypothetical protein